MGDGGDGMRDGDRDRDRDGDGGDGMGSGENNDDDDDPLGAAILMYQRACDVLEGADEGDDEAVLLLKCCVDTL